MYICIYVYMCIHIYTNIYIGISCPPEDITLACNILIPPDLLYCNTWHTLLVMTLSCKGQVGAPIESTDRTLEIRNSA